MSEYTERKTQFKDGQTLIEALKQMGFPEVENHIGKPQPLVDYVGVPRGDMADIIVRRKHVPGSSNDLGFRREADGTYTAVVSDYDNIRQGAEWDKKLRVKYAEVGLESSLAKIGARYVNKRTVNGKVLLEYLVA